MNNPNPAENEFVFVNSSVQKMLGLHGNLWEYTVTFYANNSNIDVTRMMTCNKEKLQDIKDENDQCLLEIERLQKKIEELELQVDVLQTHNNNQAKMLLNNNNGTLYKKHQYPTKKYNPFQPEEVQNTYY
jgi:hypothetical protein